MEVHVCEQREPSHIHVPRPSRLRALRERLDLLRLETAKRAEPDQEGFED